jgi:hypothetical protein
LYVQFHEELLQLRVLSLRRDENRNVRIGIFPQREEILIGCFGLGGVALDGVGAGVRGEILQCSSHGVYDNAAVVKELLERNLCSRASSERNP